MNIMTILAPIIMMLWQIMKPAIRRWMEALWQKIEDYVDEKLESGEMKKGETTEFKTAMWNNETMGMFAEKGKVVPNSDLNLMREVIHKRMSNKVAKKAIV